VTAEVHALRYQILGPVRVIRPEGVLSVSAPKMACILTALLLRTNQVIAKDALISEMWGEDPPRRASAALHVHVSQLRKLLSTATKPQGPLLTHSFGYFMDVDADEVDANVVQRLIRQGRASLDRGDAAESERLYEEALGLWRGPVLGDHCPGPIVSSFVTWIDECRLECLEGLVEAKLALGRHRAVIGLLTGLVNEYPLHEAFYGLLMRALQTSGRRADALNVYRRAWDVLDTELGLTPGSDLRALQHDLLGVEDPVLLDPRPAARVGAGHAR
jgi:DNA-binding SARP family transcriptional activator